MYTCTLYVVILYQTKEKLIASLQGGEGTRSAVSEAQLEEMRLEKEHVQAQLHSARQQIEACKTAMQVQYERERTKERERERERERGRERERKHSMISYNRKFSRGPIFADWSLGKFLWFNF